MYGALNIDENKKLITQFTCKSRDKSFKPSYSKIEQCLSNKNKSATVPKTKKISELKQGNLREKAGGGWVTLTYGSGKNVTAKPLALPAG